LIIGRAPPGTRLELDGQLLLLMPEDIFVFGFHRDATPQVRLRAIFSRRSLGNATIGHRGPIKLSALMVCRLICIHSLSI